MKEKGLERSDFLDEGGRHTTVKVFLTGATQLLTKEEMNGMLGELMPQHWQDQNIQQLVNDFYQKYTDPNQRLLKYQEQLFAQSRRLGESTQKEPSPLCKGALQQSIAVKGTNVSRNQVQQMLKNWKRQGLITQTDTGRFRKVQSDVS